VSHDGPQSILSHLAELRSRIIWAGGAVILASILALVFADPLTNILEAPYRTACRTCVFQALEPGEEFGVLMRIALFGGLILASPVVLYQVWAFINPALSHKERRWAIPIVASFVVLFVGGVLFGFWLMPRALEVLLGIFPDVRNDLRIGEYYSFVLRLLMAFGLSFQFPILLFATAAAGVVTSAQLARGRRWAVLIITIAAAAITPTGDALTLGALMVPLYLLYEITYWLIRLTLRK
jgi:sec-independent protein translocase protein TatC